MFSASLKVRTAFIEISQVTDVNVKKIKPLCPTRWLVRVSAIKNILDQYPNVLETIEEIGASEMVPEVRAMYNQVEVLIRLLLVCPASSAEAERSFSSLRRLKTWLRSTMTERRLNSVCVCHTHQDLLDSVDLRELMAVFCSRSDVRKKLFGRF